MKQSSEALIERVVRFLWRQWSALGVAGYARSEPSWIIDPEALLLFTTAIGRHDARLFDEVFDWVRKNGDDLSIQRLRHLLKAHPCGELTVLAAMAERLADESSHPKWKTMQRLASPSDDRVPQPLFTSTAFFGEADPVFKRWGWLRPPVEFRGMSQSPRPDQPATFLFKLRSLFGNQARAEVMAWLLSHEQGHPAEIAREIGYFRRSIQLVLNDLARSGHVRAFRIGREKTFSIRHDDWRFLLSWSEAGEFPNWVNWAPLFEAILAFLDTLTRPGLDEKSERFQAIQLRAALDAAMPALARAGVLKRMQADRELSGGEFVEALLADLDGLLD